MFEAAELGRKISKDEYREREPKLREELLAAQGRLQVARCPLIIVFAGVDGAGKGDLANLLNVWMDPHWIHTHAFGARSEEEAERPRYWRYWRTLPPKGHIGIFLSAWYHRPLLDRVYGRTNDAELEEDLEHVVMFERTLAEDGALIAKFWMHLGKSQQKKRLEELERDDLRSWRVTKTDWKHWKMYDEFIDASERILIRTSVGHAPWHIVEGTNERYRSLRVGELLLAAMTSHLDERERLAALEPAPDDGANGDATTTGGGATVLSNLDLSRVLEKDEYKRQLTALHARLNLRHRQMREQGRATVLVFEGWDAGGKGGAIRRITEALDARDVRVIPIAAPTDEENAQHYLWRFWRHLARAGQVVIFDRSWYGRVLVERVEGFASRTEWQRAYAEINDFEQQLTEHGMLVLKFWLHISMDEQEARFTAREQTPHKRWKLTAEDWRNRDRWDEYELAVNDMVERTSTRAAPWVLVEGNDKRFARIKVLRTVCEGMERVLGLDGDGKKRKGKKKRD